MRRHFDDRNINLLVFKAVKHGHADVADKAGFLARLLYHAVNKSRGCCFALCSRDTDAGAVCKAQEEVGLAGDLNTVGHIDIPEGHAGSFDNSIIFLDRIEIIGSAMESYIIVKDLDLTHICDTDMLIGKVMADYVIG